MENKKIFQKISNIMKKVGFIGKGRMNSQQGYMFRGIDDIYNALNEHLAEENVFFTSEIIDIKREERASKGGGILTYSILTMRFTAFAEDGSSVSSVTVGEAMDSGDKSMNKAMSVAYKYALMQLFCIPTEEEKDTEYQTHQVIQPVQQQVQKPKALSSIDNTCPSCGVFVQKTVSGTAKTGKPYEAATCQCGTKFFINRK